MIFGLDHDDPGVFEKSVTFLVKNKIAYADFFILAPFPGTRIRDRLEREGRLRSLDWSQYDSLHAVFQPKLMTPRDLEDGLWRAYGQFYSFANIMKRMLYSRGAPRTIRTLFSNFYYRSLVGKRKHPIYGF
jgi:radical SAM superfamily enzyme YgiQ (UPF0313 family)